MTTSHARPSATHSPVHTRPDAAGQLLEGHPRRPKPKGNGSLTFFTEFFRSPIELGTFLPTAAGVGKLMCKDLGLESARAVCECGPGTGPITISILERLQPGAHFFAIEYNARMAESFRRRFPQVRVYQDDATNIRTLTQREGLEGLDCVLSAVPWLVLPRKVQDAMLRETAASLRPGGRFTMVTYRPEATASVKAFRRLMESHFSNVRLKGTVWGNFPPAYVYQAER